MTATDFTILTGDPTGEVAIWRAAARREAVLHAADDYRAARRAVEQSRAAVAEAKHDRETARDVLTVCKALSPEIADDAHRAYLDANNAVLAAELAQREAWHELADACNRLTAAAMGERDD